MKCNFCEKGEMIQIPYIAHCAMLYKHEKKQKKLKLALIASNFSWVLIVLLLLR